MVLEGKRQRMCTTKQKAGSKSSGYSVLRFLPVVLCSLLIFLSGCITTGRKEAVFAVVNGESITEGDLNYMLNIAHRREDLSAAKALDISHYMQKLIADRLIIQEARRMDMEQLPEVQRAINAFLIRESVVKLHNEEIVQKVSVTAQEISDFYKKNYEKFTLAVIETGSEEEGKKALEQLKKGADFNGLAKKYNPGKATGSEDDAKKNRNEITVIRRTIIPQIEKVVTGMKPGEISDVIAINNKYVIIKLLEKKAAPDEEFEKISGSIKSEIRKQKEKERGDEYLKVLREQANVKIHRALLKTIKLDGSKEETEKWLKDKTPLVEMYGSVLTAGELAAQAVQEKQAPDFEKIKERIINTWIDYKVVDHEALRRHYEMSPALKEKLNDYKDQLLKNTFIRRVIAPKIEISDKALKKYYLDNRKSFLKPTRYKIQKIVLKTEEEANAVINSVKNGADFAWIAKNKSIDAQDEENIDSGWLGKGELPAPAREIIDTLKPGELSPALEDKLQKEYIIIRLLERTPDEAEDFNKVKEAVSRAYSNAEFKKIFDKYVEQLKADAEIKIHEGAIREFEQRFKK